MNSASIDCMHFRCSGDSRGQDRPSPCLCGSQATSWLEHVYTRKRHWKPTGQKFLDSLQLLEFYNINVHLIDSEWQGKKVKLNCQISFELQSTSLFIPPKLLHELLEKIMN